MLKIGCHLSISSGFLEAAKTIISIGGNTFQYFSRNPRGGTVKATNFSDIEQFKLFFEEHQMNALLCHAPYTLNPASLDDKTIDFAYKVFKEDLVTMELFENGLYNFHPGSHVGQGIEVGIKKIVKILNDIIVPTQKTTILLETMSGKGTEIGKTFEEISQIINELKYPDKVGVCLDTCHVFSAGYDIVHKLDEVLEEFDQLIGLDKLKAIHLNDSLMPFGSHKDRHAKIGEGTIGEEALIKIVNHSKLKHLPFFLETPNELDGYEKEIKLLKTNYN